MNKWAAFVVAMQKGGVIADAASWKKGQVTTNVLSPFILAVAAISGQSDLISTESAVAIAGGLIAIVNIVLTVGSSDKIGLRPKR